MGDIVNLNKYRKAKQLREEEQAAAINREKYGRSKAGRLAQRLKEDREKGALEAKRLEGADAPESPSPASPPAKEPA